MASGTTDGGLSAKYCLSVSESMLAVMLNAADGVCML